MSYFYLVSYIDILKLYNKIFYFMNVKLLVANITITLTVGAMKRNCMVLNCVRRREHSYIRLDRKILLINWCYMVLHVHVVAFHAKHTKPEAWLAKLSTKPLIPLLYYLSSLLFALKFIPQDTHCKYHNQLYTFTL